MKFLIRNVTSSELETDYGLFQTHVFQDDTTGKEHLALVYGNVQDENEGPVLTRVHSECLTGDVFGSERCDCRAQLDTALQEVTKRGRGIVLYLRQEGRGIGLANKLRAYALQDQGHDTVEANLELGFAADQRDFAVAAKMLHMLNISSIELLTNNPEKLESLKALGIAVSERIPIWVNETEHSRAYLATKREKLGHLS